VSIDSNIFYSKRRYFAFSYPAKNTVFFQPFSEKVIHRFLGVRVFAPTVRTFLPLSPIFLLYFSYNEERHFLSHRNGKIVPSGGTIFVYPRDNLSLQPVFPFGIFPVFHSFCTGFPQIYPHEKLSVFRVSTGCSKVIFLFYHCHSGVPDNPAGSTSI